MKQQELTKEILYGAHSSATKEKTFVITDLAEQARASHIALLLLRAVRHLPRLWISPLSVIP